MTPRVTDEQLTSAFRHYLGNAQGKTRYLGMPTPFCDIVLSIIMEVQERREDERCPT